MAKRVLVTGGAGFIPSNFIHHLLAKTPYEVVSLDALTYAENLDNLSGAFYLGASQLVPQSIPLQNYTQSLASGADPAPVLRTLDADWRFVYVNDAAERMLGRHRDELIGNVLWEAYPELLGTYGDTKPTAKALDAIAALIAWR